MKRTVVMPSLVWRNRTALVVGVLAFAQMVGDAAGWRPLVGLGSAWGISPRPKVFSDADGLEPFASTFTFQWNRSRNQSEDQSEVQSGKLERLPITPELYSRLSGPYNRRNVYGAALSYAPRLPEEIWKPAFCYGLGPQGPLRTELGLPAETPELTVVVETRTRGRTDRWELQVACTQ